MRTTILALLATLVFSVLGSAQNATDDPAAAHGKSIAAGGPFSRVPVLNAPFSADATTIVRTILPDGRPRVDTVRARYYRDSQGRVRAEMETPAGPYVVVAIPGGGPQVFRLQVDKHTRQIYAGYGWASLMFNGEGRPAIPLGRQCFHYHLPPVLADASDDERLRAVHAEVSPDLHIVTESHRSESATTVDYTVTNIRRDEPPEGLFDLTEYRLVQSSFDGPLTQFSSLGTPYSCRPLGR